MGRTVRLSYQYGRTREASIFGIPQPVARGTRIPHSEVQDRDTPYVPLHAQAHRGACLHLLRGTESVQGTRTHVEGVRNQYERGQGARFVKDHHNHTD